MPRVGTGLHGREGSPIVSILSSPTAPTRARSGGPAIVAWLALLVGALLMLAAPGPGMAQENGDAPGEEFPAGPSVELETVADGFAAPLMVTEPDDGSGRLFVVDQVGTLNIVTPGEGRADEPFLDISDRLVEQVETYDERGLLGLAFHPGYADNGRFFVYYSAPARDAAPEGWDHTSHLAEYRVDPDDPDRADPASERIIMRIDQPYANHNGGQIGFGQDGMLYVPLGDGGNGGDIDAPGQDLGRPEIGNAQTTSTLLGSVLRIDVDGDGGDRGYAIPEDNPFAGSDDAREEIWAYGFRNPYGLSFDRETGDPYVADAGQALWEEVDLVRRGGNYGWNIREGTHCFNPDNFVQPPEECATEGRDGEPLVPPVIEYPRGPEIGSVIVPGILYRGDAIDDLRGRFVFGDYSRDRHQPEGFLYVATPGEDGATTTDVERLDVPGNEDGHLGRFVLGVSQDLDGDLYALTTARGGPAGDTGELLALRPVDEDDGGWPAWASGAVAAGVVLLALVAFLAWRRRTPSEPAGS